MNLYRLFKSLMASWFGAIASYIRTTTLIFSALCIGLQAEAASSEQTKNQFESSVVLAIVDDAFLRTHVDLSPLIWTNPKEIPNNKIDDDLNGYVDDVHGWDISDADSDVTPPKGRPEYYHGTHIAGIVSELVAHSYGEASPQYLKILPVKALEDQADNFYLKDAFKGLEYAIDAGADIILTSWGVEHLTGHQEALLARAEKQGILIIASAGNFPTEKAQFPAAYPSVLAVGALSRDGQKMKDANYADFIDISTIGEDITAAGIASDTAKITKSGTSSSAAIVAAAAVLIKTKYPTLSAQEIKACLVSSASLLPHSQPQVLGKLGSGSLNMTNAIECPLLFKGTDSHRLLKASKGYVYPAKSVSQPMEWELLPQGTIKGLKLNFTHIQDKSGTVDFLAPNTRQLIAQYQLSEIPKDLYLEHPHLIVRYTSSSSNKQPWRLKYQAIHKDMVNAFCSGTAYITTPATISDGSQNQPYSYNTNCKWQISAPEGKLVQIDFSELNTESRTDMVYLFNGKKTNAPIMAIFSGTKLPPPITSWGSEVLVWFVANDRTQGQGWQANVSFIDPPASQ